MMEKRRLKFLVPGLVSWLKNPPKKNWGKEVEGIIREIRELSLKRKSRLWKSYLAVQLVKLSFSLRRYRFVPTPVQKRDGSLVFEWTCDPAAKIPRELSMTVFVVLRIVEQGDLWRVRQCEICNSWMAARSRNQTACSTNCRQKRYRESPKGKRKHKRYMKKYYREHRDAKG